MYSNMLKFMERDEFTKKMVGEFQLINVKCKGEDLNNGCLMQKDILMSLGGCRRGTGSKRSDQRTLHESWKRRRPNGVQRNNQICEREVDGPGEEAEEVELSSGFPWSSNGGERGRGPAYCLAQVQDESKIGKGGRGKRS